MAGFDFSEAQEMFRREVRGFVQAELAPRSKEIAKMESVPRDVAKKLGEAGLIGIIVPEEEGGQGGDWVSLGIACEELAKGAAFAAPYVITQGVLGYTWLQDTSEEVRQEWLLPIIKGDKMCSWGLTEPGAGSDAVAIQTLAVKEGEYYILNGEKAPITFGTAIDVIGLCARTDPKAKARGITLFWLPMDLPGITKTRMPHTGWKPMSSASMFLDNVRLPAKYRVGEEGAGFSAAMGVTDVARVGLALTALGLAEISLEETISYALQRTAFGQPIARFEGVSFKIAEHATLLEAARLLCYRTLYLHDQGIAHRKETAMCKWWCPQVAFDAIHDCLLIHGHLGYSEEFPLEQRLRDVLGIEFTDGTADMMKITVARELMGKMAVPY